MIIDRVFTPGLAQVAYLVADEVTRRVAVIDPRRDVEEYIAWAEQRGMEIAAILETHVHADFVSGARELAAATGATVYASRLGESEFEHQPIDDGDTVSLGSVTLRALWTPGHTPEHMSFLAFNSADEEVPVALFSGDVLFVGEVGRPDLLGDKETQRLAEHLYNTVSERLRPLPDTVVVYPGHTAGSACGKKIGDAPSTTIGQERRDNYAFKARSKDEFVEQVLKDMPKPPTYYPVLKRINKIGAPLLAELDEPFEVTPERMADAQMSGALLVDARTPEAFADGHVAGSVFVGLGENFTAWLGWIAPYNRDLLFVVEGSEHVAEVLTELRRIGLDRAFGYLPGGMKTWRRDHDDRTLDLVSVEELAGLLQQPGSSLAVLDVRTDDERNEGHIHGSVHRFAGDLAQGSDPPVSKTDHVAVLCASGYRSSVASSLLQKRGYTNVVNVLGGMDAWNEAGLPVTPASKQTSSILPEH